MNINYILQVHQSPTQLKRLVSRLNDKNIFFYIHVDKKSNIEPFKKELNDFNNIFFFEEDRISVYWGDLSQIKATLLAINKIIKDKRTGYCVLMSGQDYPIKSNEYIFNFLSRNYGLNFIGGRPIEDVWETYKKRINNYNFSTKEKSRDMISLYTIYHRNFYSLENLKNLKRLVLSTKRKYLYKIFIPRKLPICIKQYGGSQWWVLPIETIQYISNFVKNNETYLKYHEFTHVPDEIFFHSIILNKFQTNVIKKSLTYVNWSAKNRPLPVTFELDDYNELVDNNYLFARKFNEESSILDKVDREILYNANFNHKGNFTSIK